MFAALAIAAFANAASAQDYRLGDLHIRHASTRETPIAGGTALGNLEIENAGRVEDRLLDAHSDAAAAVEIHRMTTEGGIMRMRPQTDGLRIPAKSTTMLGADAPEGYHLMLIGVKTQLKAGGTLPVTLHFAKAGEIKIELQVQALTSAGGAMP